MPASQPDSGRTPSPALAIANMLRRLAQRLSGRSSRRARIFLASLAIGVVVACLPEVCERYFPPAAILFTNLEARAYDLCFLWRDKEPARSDIIIVGIDDESFQELERFPWPRRFYADAVRNLQAAGARVVAFDVLFTEYAPLSAEEEQRQEWISEDDRLFAAAIADAGNVILGADFTVFTGAGKRLSEDAAYTITSPALPIPELREPAICAAPVDLPRDTDGFVRAFYLAQVHVEDTRQVDEAGNIIPDSGDAATPVVYPSLAAAVAGAYLGLSQDDLCTQLAHHTFAGRAVPGQLIDLTFDERGRPTHELTAYQVLINFAGPPNLNFDYVPFYQVRDPELFAQQAHRFEDKIVIIGATTEQLHDIFPTPFVTHETQDMAGPEIQAHAISTLLDAKYIRRLQDPWQQFLLASCTLIMAALTFWLRPVRTLPLLGLLMIALVYAQLVVFADHRLWVQTVTANLSMIVAFIGVSTLLFFTEEREKRRIRGLFGRYVGPTVMKEILDRPSIEMRGETREVTLIFSDLRGFTTIAQDLPPQEVVGLLRPYLARMTEVVFKHQGTLDKFMGDGIMAYFGAPVPYQDHAEKAVRAALEMQEELLRLQDQRPGGPELYMRIGVHTGEAVVGDIGSETLSEYTVIGDVVNTASRLEGLNKQYGTRILISGETYERVKDLVVAEYIGEEVVKGRDEPTRVYHLLSLRDDAHPEQTGSNR
ncbi:MAG: CHASE2 domain-containing protein [Armatimonadota bacterium]